MHGRAAVSVVVGGFVAFAIGSGLVSTRARFLAIYNLAVGVLGVAWLALVPAEWWHR